MISITGDINLTDGYFDTGFGVGSSIVAGADPFAAIPRSEEDIWIGNFEGVTSHSSSKSGLHARQFLIAPDKLSGLHHFDYYNVANNHSMQHGGEAFSEMLDHLNSFGSTYFGSMERHSAEFSYKGKRFSITGFSQRKENFDAAPGYWYNPEYDQIADELRRCSQNDFKIVYVHWGIEFMDRPYNDQIRFAHMLIDMGYDLVVGLHPHLMQGYELYKGKFIFYSIGNFVFHMHWEPLRYGAIVDIDVVDGEIVTGYRYVRIGNDYFPRIVEESNVPEAYRFTHLNTLLGYELSNEEYHALLRKRTRAYRWDNRLAILRNLPKLKSADACSMIRDFVKRHV